MELASSVTEYLRPVADAFVFINTTKVHPIWFPYALAPTLHAARISMVFQSNARKSPTPLSWGTYIFGFLIMAWGGGLLSHFWLGLPPPMLYSFHPAINYISVHLFFTLLFQAFPDLLYPPILDTVFWPVDALLRANAVTLTLGLFASPNVHPDYRNSPLAHFLLGAIASSGGGLSAATFSLWSPNWTFSTPPPLRAGAGWAGTLDIWGGSLVALIYSSTTHHPAFTSLHTYTTLILSSPLLSGTRKPHADSDFPPLNSLEAKSLAGVVLGLFFAARVIKQHWLIPLSPAQVPSKPTAITSPSKKAKKKVQ
ncbi:hypothetical protein CPB84DRAFT_1966259 [Gymnopilus junonius]|uniref:Uncharacterized protein n=1 Tax=Gymnopilus junonius TaxID=109634 RepID=A0A9P5THU1_GYMJU|nr:hypothetical protein CPB84DRAFT_1966259 [Gymnopilus junonius]